MFGVLGRVGREINICYICFLVFGVIFIIVVWCVKGLRLVLDCFIRFVIFRFVLVYWIYGNFKMGILIVVDKVSVRNIIRIYLLIIFWNCIVSIIVLTIFYWNDSFIWLIVLLVFEFLEGIDWIFFIFIFLGYGIR